MTKSLAKAGYDTSRLEAHVIAAKANGAAQRKRKRNDAGPDESMDVDEEGDDSGEWEDEAMEVDGAPPAKSPKRVKGNSGAAVAKPVHPRAPAKNRQLAGLKNSDVRSPSSSSVSILTIMKLISNVLYFRPI